MTVSHLLAKAVFMITIYNVWKGLFIFVAIMDNRNSETYAHVYTYIRVPTGQGKLEELREFEWPGKVRGKYFLEKLGKSPGK